MITMYIMTYNFKFVKGFFTFFPNSQTELTPRRAKKNTYCDNNKETAKKLYPNFHFSSFKP